VVVVVVVAPARGAMHRASKLCEPSASQSAGTTDEWCTVRIPLLPVIHRCPRVLRSPRASASGAVRDGA